MAAIQAIETKYKGYRFRSRLEARWAVFFDALGIRYKYEEYGFEKTVDGVTYRWLPDFYLPDSCTWVEVKGGKVSEDDALKMAMILSGNDCPIPFFERSGKPESFALDAYDQNLFEELGGIPINTHSTMPGVLMLGEIPDCQDCWVVHNLIVKANKKDLLTARMHFKWKNYLRVFPNCQVSLLSEICESKHDTKMLGTDFCVDRTTKRDLAYLFDAESFVLPIPHGDQEVINAYKKARAARFEHGQTP